MTTPTNPAATAPNPTTPASPTRNHNKPANIGEALASPTYLFSKWPWVGIFYTLIGTLVSMVINSTVIVVLLLLSISKTIRQELWPMVLRWDIRRLRLINPPAADRLDAHLQKMIDTGTPPSLRQYLHIALVMFILGPLSPIFVFGIPALQLLFTAGIPNEDGTILWQMDAPLSWILFAVSIPIGLYIAGLWAYALGELADTLLQPTEAQLTTEVQRLAHTRSGLLDAATAERTRIERALHDGTQHRLVALSMQLGLAEATAEDDETKELANTTQKEIDEILVNLRNVIRNIQPQALSERGLAAAVADITANSPIPVKVDIPATRLGKHVEETAFFVTSAALSNVVKHSGATQAEVTGELNNGIFTLTITDNGNGGATELTGHGIEGLKQRAAAIDGTVEVTSPAGGPTTLTLVCPLVQ